MSRIFGAASFSQSLNFETLPNEVLSSFNGSKLQKVATHSSVLAWKGDKTSIPVGEFQDVSVVIDGRILNSKELCGEFLSIRNDIELVSQLYRMHGFEKMLGQLEGDFAIVLFDAAEQRLYLGRDRFGVKPLYYATIGDSVLVCGSQPRVLLAVEGVDADLNNNFLARFVGMHYRTFDNNQKQSPYANIQQVPPGHLLAFQKGSTPKIERYWCLNSRDEWREPKEELSEKYRDLLLRAVKKRVSVTDRPAFTLSGGLDSSSVLCCAAEVLATKQSAFSTVYSDPTFDERTEIQDVVNDRVDEWCPVELGDDIDIFQIVKDMVSIHDEPVATATWLSHFLLAKEVAGKGFTSLFGGLGGDELNAGEYEYFPMYFADLRVNGQLETLEREIEAWAGHHDHAIHRKNRQIAEKMMQDTADLSLPGRCLPNQERMLRYSKAVDKSFVDLSDFKPVMDEPYDSYLKNRTYQDMVRETLPCCLRAEDRQCTAAGLDHFDPFLDHHLVEFMFRVPGDLKIRNGVTKQLLRSAMKGILPEATRQRIAKTGWNAPAHKWFGDQTLSRLRDVATSTRFRGHGLFNADEVLRLIDEHERIVRENQLRENHMMFLWQLLNVIVWLELD